ncbi:MAG: hypothetical protein O2905_04350 [Proteobacteria bacterium]|nr:hypothetical protein [Pseudomonadota bacterium]
MLPGAASAQEELVDTGWTADSGCFLRDVYFYADGDAEIGFGSSEFDFGYWYYDEGVVMIDFEFYFDTFLGIYDGTTIRIAHAYTLSDEPEPHIELCVLYRDQG